MTVENDQIRDGAKTRVVVAEDEVLIRLDLVEMLTEEGYDYRPAGDGKRSLVPPISGLSGVDGLKRPSSTDQCADADCHERIAPGSCLQLFSQRSCRSREPGRCHAYVFKPFSKADLVPELRLHAPGSQRFKQSRPSQRSDERLESRKWWARQWLAASAGADETRGFRWFRRRP